METITRARMSTTRACIYHVNNEDAVKAHAITVECLAHMMFECFVQQVTAIGGDANKVACQHRAPDWKNFLWNERLSILVGSYGRHC